MAEVNIKGLTSKEVRRLRLAGYYNKQVTQPSKTVKEIVKSNLLTYFNFVFLFIAIILALVGSFRDLTFLPVIIVNSLIGIWQELRAKSILDKLTVLHAPHATVVREGKKRTIPVDRLVLDDVVFFKAGNQIPADAVVIEGDVMVNEALLTGEEDEVPKKVDDELLSGSFVVSGECYAKLTKVGADSYISKLTLQAKATKVGEQSEIVRSLNKIVKLAGIAIIPIGLILFLQGYFFSDAGLKASVQSMAAAIIGMIPEGLFLLSSVTLAISAMRLAFNRVLLHDMKSIETLARVDTLCLDKTGTITDGKMEVMELVPLGQELVAVEKLMGDYVKAHKADSTTMEALKQHFKETDGLVAHKVIGFSSKYKYSAAQLGEKNYVLGAPEFVMHEKYEKHKDLVEEYSKKGLRVLVLGEYTGELTGQELDGKIEPVGLVILNNHVRESARETFKYFAEQGVEIKVISGDNPLTVAEVARQAGIEGAERQVDATTLKTEADLAAALKQNVVFGRVTPEQKRKLIRALKKAGHTVAMTGDGVNDILALKDADCGIAMASGSDAAVQTAQLVLLDSDFAKMPSVVLEGRRVVNNLERSGSLFLVKNVFSFVMALLAIIFSFNYPLLPTQVSLITLWTIGAPAFFLAQIPNDKLIKGRFVDNILAKAVPAGLTDVVLVSLMVIIGMIMGQEVGEIATACTLIMLVVGLAHLYTVCRPFDLYKRLIWCGSLLGVVVCLVFLNWMFGLSEMSVFTIIPCVILMVVALPLLKVLIKLTGFLRVQFYKRLVPRLVRYGQRLKKEKIVE